MYLLINLLIYRFMYRYRPAQDSEESVVATSPKKTKSEIKTSKSSSRGRKDELWTGEITLSDILAIIILLILSYL